MNNFQPHDMYYPGRPLEPYQDAPLAINHFLTDHEITPFIKEIDKIHAVDQTAEVEGTKGMTPEGLAKEALYEAGEFAGINDFYRAIFGEEPIFEQEISEEEWEESV
ncbi:hypothetical protein, partial [Numidum massiliense]|uniref:hypothetical protein n=1 Tax=Numidum massiliense TaxID=1522315 RepID=UPI0011CAE7A5